MSEGQASILIMLVAAFVGSAFSLGLKISDELRRIRVELERRR